MKILLIGMNHESAPVEVREHYAPDDTAATLAKLVSHDEIQEAVMISTCNRVELVVTTDRVEEARHRLSRFFASTLAGGAPNPSDRSLDEFTYEHSDRDAVSHVFRVAASLDSMVVGEPQILGQMKNAYREAVECHACGPVLSRLFQRAFATAKRVKNETRIAERPVSVARVAVDLARQIFEELDDKKALLIGAGEMIELALMALQREGLMDIRVANRTVSRAEDLAARFSASAHSFDELDDLLQQSDVVLTCIGGDRPLLSYERVSAALQRRRFRPVFFIDIGVPRNVDPRVDEIDSAYLYDMDDLHAVAMANRGERDREASRGEQIVMQEQQQFEGWMTALQAVPTIRHLRARAESIRSEELRRMAGRLHLDDDQADAVEVLTRSIVNKILHPPLSRLRREADREAGIASMEAARSLFALDDPTAPGAGGDDALRAELERERLRGGLVGELYDEPLLEDCDDCPDARDPQSAEETEDEGTA